MALSGDLWGRQDWEGLLASGGRRPALPVGRCRLDRTPSQQWPPPLLSPRQRKAGTDDPLTFRPVHWHAGSPRRAALTARQLEAKPPQLSHRQMLCSPSQLFPTCLPAHQHPCTVFPFGGFPPTASVTFQDTGSQATPSPAPPPRPGMTRWLPGVPSAPRTCPVPPCLGASALAVPSAWMPSLGWRGCPSQAAETPFRKDPSRPQAWHSRPVGQFWKISPPGVSSLLRPRGPQVAASQGECPHWPRQNQSLWALSPLQLQRHHALTPAACLRAPQAP